MIDHLKLIFDFIKSHHPLGKGISLEEIRHLTINLSSRLMVSQQLLDYSPDSLKLLDSLIEHYYQKHIDNIDEIEVMDFIRELSAYFGKVIINNTDGQWIDNGDLWRTEIHYKSGFIIIKGGKKQTSQDVTISLGNIAATALDTIALGSKPGLFTLFKNIARHKLKEKF
jgi:hypothetical protein